MKQRLIVTPFIVVENTTFRRLLEFLQPNLNVDGKSYIPSRKSLSGKILNEAAQQAMLTTQSIASNQNGVTLTFDSWTNVKKENILGVVLMTHRGDTLIWDAIDCSGQRIRTSDVVSKIQVILK